MKQLVVICISLTCLVSYTYSQNIDWTPEEEIWINQHQEISFGYEPHWEPYEIYENGEYSGIVGEYLEIISKQTGINFNPIPDLNWKESLDGLKNGTIKMVPCCAITAERKKYLAFSDVYIKDAIVIVTRDDGPYLNNLNDLKNMSVALSQNYYTIELIESKYPEININKKETIEDCLKSVVNGESQAFIGNLNVISYYMNNMGYSNLKIVGTTDFEIGNIAMAVTPSYEMLTQIVNKVLANISSKQKHNIRADWIAQPKESSLFSGNSLIWIIIMISAIVVVFSVLYYWNKVLRKIIKRKKQTEQQLKESLIAIKKNDEEKKVLLQEIHHRVKNNLQVVSSMMRIQSNVIDNKVASRTLSEAVERIKTIALVHDRIYKSPGINTVDLKPYIDSLHKDILLQFEGINPPDIHVEGSDVSIQMDKIVPLALILNELITNSVKYAFDNQPNPRIEVQLSTPKSTGLKMIFADNGKWKENDKSDRFGTSLIEIFVEQLDGNYTIDKKSNGTIYTFNFNTLMSKGKQ